MSKPQQKPQPQATPAQVAKEFASEAIDYGLDHCGIPLNAEAKQAIKDAFIRAWEDSEHRLGIDLADAADQQ